MSILMTIGAFIPGLFNKKLSNRAASLLGGALLVLALASLFSLGKCAYDASVIAKHEAQERARKAQAQLEADRAAEQATEEQARDLAETQNELQAAQAEAARNDPARAASPVGPVTEAYYDTLRKKKGAE